MKNKKPTILLLLMFLLCVVAGCNKGTANSSAEEAIQPKDTTPAIEISAGDLAKEWDANRAATDEKYAGKTLAVTGKPTVVSTYASGEYASIQLGIGEGEAVFCMAKPSEVTKELERILEKPSLPSPAIMTIKGVYSKGSPDSPYFKINPCEPLITLADMKNSKRAPLSAADCPTSIFSVKDVYDDEVLEQYMGCTMTVRGKLWEVRDEYVVLIDTTERTDGNSSRYCAGDFTSATYTEVGDKLTQLKMNSDYEKLPKVTFKGIVKATEGSDSIGLKNCVMTEFTK